MRALGLWQPYASLIALGIKTLETRPWKCQPGPVMICSTQKLVLPTFDDVGQRIRDRGFQIDISDFPLGVMLCVVDILECRLCDQIDDEELACASVRIGHAEGNLKFGFVLGEPKQVKHKPVKCRQKWFNVPDNEIEYL
jgi:hypothetical protein